MAKLYPNPNFRVIKSDGTPAAGWQMFTYEAGTSTKKDTYTDVAQSSTHTNPIILDSKGEVEVYWNGVYKLVASDENDTDPPTAAQFTIDNYGSGQTTTAPDADNNAVNGSFEADTNGDGHPDDWVVTEYTGGTVAIDTSVQDHGASSLKFTSAGSGGGYIISESFFKVSPSRLLSTSFHIKSSVADVRNLVELVWYDASQVETSTPTSLYDDSTANPTSWTVKKAVATPPAGAFYAKLRMYGCHSSDATSGSTWYDGVRVEIDYTEHETDGTHGRLIEDRALLEYSTTSAIKIGAGSYKHFGTSTQLLYWDSQLTFTIGSGGSNSDSSAAGTSQFQYIYIDDSAVVTLGLKVLTAAEILNSTTAPTYSHAKHGWYNSNDRCIGAIYINSSGNIESFWQVGNATYYNAYHEYLTGGSATSYTAVSPRVPTFAKTVLVTAVATGASGHLFDFSVDGSVRHIYFNAATGGSSDHCTLPLNSSLQHYYLRTSGTGTMTFRQTGYEDSL